MIEKIGEFSEKVVSILKRLGVDIAVGTAIYLGESNRWHMERQHPRDYKKYFGRISRIIAEPDFVGLQSDGSIEYIKKFGSHIKVAVRISLDGDYYARTLYHVEEKMANNLINKGKWKHLKD